MKLGFIEWAILAAVVASIAAIFIPWNAENSEKYPFYGQKGVHLRTDTITGCEYLVYRDSITPRLQPDGNPYCKDGTAQ